MELPSTQKITLKGFKFGKKSALTGYQVTQ